jgi:uncharacterized repeat protein (TIGR01451 family)
MGIGGVKPRIWGCERASARSHPQIRYTLTGNPKEPEIERGNMKTRIKITYLFVAFSLMISLLFSALGIRPANAATELGPGDIAIIGFSFHPADNFAFVLLVDIEAGTEIRFTDAGWTSNSEFFSGEGVVRYTAPVDLDAGTVIYYLENSSNFEITVEGPFTLAGGVAFTDAGDQLLAFQGLYTNPTFLYALNNDAAGWTPSLTNAQTTTLPPGLTDGYTAISLGRIARNGVYTGSFSGTREQLLSAISDPSNWYNTNGGVTMPSSPFVIDPGYPEVISTMPAVGATNVLRYDPIIIQFDEDVELAEGWYEIACIPSGIHTASVVGETQVFVLDPDEDFVLDDECTVTVYADKVTDFDDTPKNMEEDYVWSFSVLKSQDLNVGFTSNSPVVVGDLAEFTNITEGQGEITYQWDFGDGSGTSIETSPSYLFSNRGTYMVTLTASNDDGEDTLTQEFVVFPVPFIRVEKVVDVEIDVPLGSVVTYSITIDNTGSEIAEAVALSDSLPEEVSFIEQLDGPALTFFDNVLNWTGDIEAGESVFFEFSVAIGNDPDLYGETITNTAYVTSAIAGSDASVAAFTIESEPLLVSFASNSPVILGETAVFTNTTTGDGPISYIWDFGDGSDTSSDIHPQHVYTATGSYTVLLTATNSRGVDTYSATFDVLTEPVITVDKSVTPISNIVPGESMIYTITIENDGEYLAMDVRLLDTLPDGILFIEQLGGPELAVNGDELSWNGNVTGKGSVVFDISVQVEDDPALYGKMVTNTAYVDSLNAGDDESSASFTIDPSPAELTIRKQVSANVPVALSEQVTYTITLSNSGQTEATNVSLEDILPEGLTIGELVGESQGEIIPVDNTLTWNGTVPGESEVVIEFTAIVDEDTGLYGEEIENTVTFYWQDGSGSDKASIMVELSPAMVTISKNVTPSLDVSLGGVVNYTITMTNHGGKEAVNVVMSDILPASLTVLSVQGGGAASENTVGWTGSIDGQSSKTISFTAALHNSSSLYGQSVRNTVTFTSTNAGHGQAAASFLVTEVPKVYLPVITN